MNTSQKYLLRVKLASSIVVEYIAVGIQECAALVGLLELNHSVEEIEVKNYV